MTCTFSESVDAHFDRGLTPAREHALRAHLPACALCKRRYERQMLLEALTGPSSAAKARIRRGLPIAAAWRRWVTPVAGAMALAACALLFLGRSRSEGFHARGQSETPAAAPRVEVYRVTPGAPPTRIADAIGRSDELAFAYANPTGKKRLLVFAADEHRHVYWYFPAWTRPDDDPMAVPIVATSDLVELKEAVAHPFDADRVVLHAIFTDDAPTARSVEKRIAEAPPLAATIGFEEAIETSKRLEVR
jgi:hypothetical protein